MKRNAWIYSVLIVAINFPVSSTVFASDIDKEKVKEAVATKSKKIELTDNKAQAEKPTDEASESAKEEKLEASDNSVQSFNSGLSSMVAEMMEDDSLKEEDQQVEDLKD